MLVSLWNFKVVERGSILEKNTTFPTNYLNTMDWRMQQYE